MLSIGPNLCLLFSVCCACTDCGLLFLMYLMCCGNECLDHD